MKTYEPRRFQNVVISEAEEDRYHDRHNEEHREYDRIGGEEEVATLGDSGLLDPDPEVMLFYFDII